MVVLINSVIICTRNRLHELSHALTSIAKQSLAPDELIVIDSSDQPVERQTEFLEAFSAARFPETRLRYHHTHPGLTYQRNVGVDYATGQLLHFLDDDVELEPGYLTAMQEAFNDHPQHLGGMGAVQNINGDGNGRLRELYQRLFLLQRNYARGTFTLSGMPTHTHGITNFTNVEALGGCCMSFRRAVFTQHRFDESLTGYAFMEDCDFSYRVSRQGLLFFTPHARLIHFRSPVGRDPEVCFGTMVVRNYTYLFFKNFYPLNRLRIIAYVWSLLGIVMEAIIQRKWNMVRGYMRGLWT